jgi:Zn-dependent peptidase ImmA (M78 family)
VGHLVLHPEPRPGDHQHEREAHLFAAELLMPEELILDELPARPDVSALVPLQQRWGVSVSALGFRGRVLGKYTEAQQRRLMMTLSQLGWRTNEPEDERLLSGEEPALLSRAIELATPTGVTVAALARELALPVTLVRSLVGIPDTKPRLTLVPGGVETPNAQRGRDQPDVQ